MTVDRSSMVGATRPVLIILLAVAVIMIDGFDLQAIGFVAPEIAHSWGLPIAAFGVVFSAALAGSMLGAMTVGSASRLAGRRVVLATALLLFGCSTLATAWIDNLPALIALRLAVGVGIGAAPPIAVSIVAGNSPTRFRTTLVVLTLCGQPVGAILGAALCARYIPVYGWPYAFYVGGIIPLLLVCVVLFLPGIDTVSAAIQPGAPPGTSAGRLRDLVNPAFLATTVLLWFAAFLSVFFVYLIVNWLPSFVRSLGYSLQVSVLALSLFNFGGIAGALLAAALIDRYGPWKVMPIAFGIAGLSLAALDSSGSARLAFLAVSFLTGVAGYGGVMSLGALPITLYPPSLHTTGVGWLLGIGRLGAALGPLGAGVALAAGLGLGRLFYFAAAASILVMMCLILLGRQRSQSSPKLNVG